MPLVVQDVAQLRYHVLVVECDPAFQGRDKTGQAKLQEELAESLLVAVVVVFDQAYVVFVEGDLPLSRECGHFRLDFGSRR